MRPDTGSVFTIPSKAAAVDLVTRSPIPLLKLLPPVVALPVVTLALAAALTPSTTTWTTPMMRKCSLNLILNHHCGAELTLLIAVLSCMNQFTAGQITRFAGQLRTYRGISV